MRLNRHKPMPMVTPIVTTITNPFVPPKWVVNVYFGSNESAIIGHVTDYYPLREHGVHIASNFSDEPGSWDVDFYPYSSVKRVSIMRFKETTDGVEE